MAIPMQVLSCYLADATLGQEHPNVAILLQNLGMLYQADRKYAEAEPLLKRSLTIREKALGPDHPDVASSLNNLAELHRAQAKYAKAEPLFKRSLAIMEKALGPEHPEVAGSLQNLGMLYQADRKYAEAEPLFKRSLAIREKAFGSEHPDVATSLEVLAKLYFYQRKPDEAELFYLRSLALRMKTMGPDHTSVASTLNLLSIVYWSQGRYAKAEYTLKRALEIKEKALGPEHLGVASLLEDLAEVYKWQGNYGETVRMYKRSLAIQEKALGLEHPGVASSLANLAEVYKWQGNYDEILRLYKRRLAIQEKALGPEHPDVANGLERIASAYKYQGNYDEAERLYKLSLAIREKAFGSSHPSVVNSLSGLGEILMAQGDQRGAIGYFERSLAIVTETGDGPEAWLIYDLMANLFMDMGDLSRAESLVRQTPIHSTRGRLHLLKGEYEEAKYKYWSTRDSAEKYADIDLLLASYIGLGQAYEGLGESPRAEKQYRKALEIAEDLRSSLDQIGRQKFFEAQTYGFSRLTPYEGLARVLLKMDQQVQALKTSEYGKARVFAERISIRVQDMRSDIPADIVKIDKELNDQLSVCKSERRRGLLEPSTGRAEGFYSLVERWQLLMTEHIGWLRQRYPLFAATKYPEPVDMAHSGLQENEWVLEYDVTDSGLLIYLVRGKNLVKCLFRPIPRKELDGLVKKFMAPFESKRASITVKEFEEKLKSFDFASGSELSKIVLDDILEALPPSSPLIVVPDGCLAVLPFEMLVLNGGGQVKTGIRTNPVTGRQTVHAQVNGAVFFGDRNPISYYQSITALTLARHHAKPSGSQNKMLVMADPVFDLKDRRAQAATGMAHLPSEQQSAYGELYKELYTKMAGTRDSGSDGLYFPPLPLTGRLAEGIGKIYEGDCRIHTGLEASKEHFMKNVRPKLAEYNQVVFATHGYFGNDIPGIQEPVLVLTLVPPGVDGYLRMSEVMGLNLNADMVALTACQTGVGQRLSGEGTMGMGRAFQYAGAKSVLMSLWSVAEESSVKLVESFFKHRKDNKGKLEALKLARKEIRDQGYDHPFFWAPLVLVGEVD
jgi:tetratricopeptide (TPR) repeat protein